MEIFDKNPAFNERFEKLCRSRRNEILAHMLETSSEYKQLCDARAEMSMALKKTLLDSEAHALLEEYSDAVYAQEVYELDAIYRQAFIDALAALRDQDLL